MLKKKPLDATVNSQGSGNTMSAKEKGKSEDMAKADEIHYER